ncbi:Nop6p ASCRUDRAFT_36460 [Ascoidea rubescens DSM 1968]|uniref:RRM domain-containing protein n=1 Tax=Ascoidea rubescens DSM 1968 TaxID=1344418 RepID=A0A1D2VF02_9ASCO|nr:hypothetical protein ASCRUDRAFT_36460 [Ascoidea rubescens DSM 1968]ODV60231.1 hypothetical protein ASCRUDRAFT_36460 [Ascoidea rubescens DSM 1968]
MSGEKNSLVLTEKKKLTKKQLKTLNFHDDPKDEKKDKIVNAEIKDDLKSEEPTKKKRKTRRGKKNRDKEDSAAPRFLLFVGNLPYEVTEKEISENFSKSKPDEIRIRKDKGIAFLEFKGDNIKQRMDIALKQHRHNFLTTTRKINVELTAGGGGNTKARLEKIKAKNGKLMEERRQQIIEEDIKSREKKKNSTTNSQSTEKKSATDNLQTSAVHPSRLKLMNKLKK